MVTQHTFTDTDWLHYEENMSFGSPPSVELSFKSDRGLTIEICLGDVTEARADGIVVPEGTSFQQTGFVAQRLMEIDHKYGNIREKLVQKNGSFEAWEVYTRKFGKRFTYVICGIVPPCYEDVGAWKSKLTLLYQRIFREAERKIVPVLAVPLLAFEGNMSFGSPPSVELRFKMDRGLAIEICLGDVTEAKADGIVVPEGTSFQHTGFVAKRLMEIDHKYGNIREKLAQKNGSFEAWEVYTRKFGKRFTYVICGILPPCSEDVNAWKSKLMLLYHRIFTEADRKVMSVLAVPLLGSGRGGGTLDDVIEVAVVSAAKVKGSSFSTVMFVSNDPEVCTQMKRACGCKKQEQPHSGTSRPSRDKQPADSWQRQSAKRKSAVTMSKHPSNKPSDKHSLDIYDKSKSSHVSANGASKEKVALPKNVFTTNNEYFLRYDWRVSDRDGATGGCTARGREKDSSHRELFTSFESTSLLHMPKSRSMATDIFVPKTTRRNNDARGEEEVVPRFETGKRQHPRVFNDQDEFRSMSKDKSPGRFDVPPFQHDSSKRHIISDVDEQDDPERNSDENMMDKGYQGTDTRIHHVNKHERHLRLGRAKGTEGRQEDLKRKESQRSKHITKDLERLNEGEHSDDSEKWQQKSFNESLSSHIFQESGMKDNNKMIDGYPINDQGFDYQPTKHRSPGYHDEREKLYDDECEHVDADHADKTRHFISVMKKDTDNQLQPGSKVDMDHVTAHKEKGEVSSSASWTQMKSGTQLISLSRASHEYQDVEHSFMASKGPQQWTVQEIQRVQSITLWQSYCLRKQELESRDPDVQNERVLWHGTTRESVQSICKNGFNRSFSGKNAAQYGDGVYFARDCSYAADDTYSIPDTDGSKYVFRSRVLTGTYTKGEKGMRHPPWRDQEQHLMYDSLVNNVDRPELYVVFHDAQAYPEYLVKFI